MDLGDLLFLGVLIASGIATTIGAKKKKAAVAGPLSKRPQISPSTALPSTPDTGLRKTMPAPSKARVTPAMHTTPAAPAGMGARPFAAKNQSPRPKRRHWREYLIMKEVLGPPVSMRGVNEDSNY
ncbi:MAG: hypothetical protein HOO04_02555 [Phycisphaerae bacterium]|nr:hypothetical protein [Phycisphaerae bacterium]MBT5583265.1 hypothetical protein [Phycisphaerae bacterium]